MFVGMDDLAAVEVVVAELEICGGAWCPKNGVEVG